MTIGLEPHRGCRCGAQDDFDHAPSCGDRTDTPALPSEPLARTWIELRSFGGQFRCSIEDLADVEQVYPMIVEQWREQVSAIPGVFPVLPAPKLEVEPNPNFGRPHVDAHGAPILDEDGQPIVDRARWLIACFGRVMSLREPLTAEELNGERS